MSQSQRRRVNKVKHPVVKNSRPQHNEKGWRKSADKAMEVFICVGHIVAVVTIIVEHVL